MSIDLLCSQNDIASQPGDKFVDLSLYTRVPRPMARPHPLPNEIYIHSNPQPFAPLLKRIKQLMFDGNVDSVHLHAAGKQIPTAVRLAVDFTNAYTPWFTTLSYTSTEIVIDDYVPKVTNLENGIDPSPPPLHDKVGDMGNGSNQGDSFDQTTKTITTTTTTPATITTATKRKAPATALSTDSNDTNDQITQSQKRTRPNPTPQELPSSSATCAGDLTLVQLVPSELKSLNLSKFSRERLISAIHIVISKTAEGLIYVR